MTSLFLAHAIGQDQAERLYDNAVTFLNAGKIKEANTDFERVISNYADSPWAPKALLQLGDYYLTREKDHVRALEYFQKIQDNYASSADAAAAYYFKALIIEQHGKSQEELNAAVSDLVRMSNLYPGNAWQSDAQFLFGKLQFRLGDYDQSLSFFQRLEFSYPDSPNLPEAFLLSARAAYLKGSSERASVVLARLQARFPNNPEAARAASWLRLLSRFEEQNVNFQTDRSFFGGTPKKFASPEVIMITPDDKIAVMDKKGAYLYALSGGQPESLSGKDLANFCVGRRGRLMLVYKSRIVSRDGTVSYTGLAGPKGELKGLRSAAVDEFGRLFAVDSGARDLIAFTQSGELIKSFNMNRPRVVRTLGAEVWAVDDDATGLKKFTAGLQPGEHNFPSLKSIEDFCFDDFNNLYVLYDRGYQVSIYDPTGQVRFSANIKGGSFPLKQAQSISVDASGAFYLSDKRGGAVFRFH
ncbi:MAG: tetratricopeptide repeat protein [Acidobacteriota bacterium]|nr:tetratricopeptide repeat protein [Acidobacteriota bacterium]